MLQRGEKPFQWWEPIFIFPFLAVFMVGLVIGLVAEPIRQGVVAARKFYRDNGWMK
jgi:hypothetical protein